VIALPALCLCALLGGDKVELRFAPAEGSEVRRTITIDQGAAPLTTHRVLRTLDQYRKVGDGRPLLLRRHFEQTELPFEGTSVVYTWIPEEKAYGKYYDAREGSELALRDLAEDLDLRALLPTEPVAVSEAWSLPVAGLRDVLAPLGDLDLRDAKGECKLELAAVGEVQGRSLATIELTLRTASPTWSFEGRGTLVWDLGAQRAASFALQGNQTRLGSLACTWKFEDPASK